MIFEDVGSELLSGEIIEALEKGRSRSSDAMPGKIRCHQREE